MPTTIERLDRAGFTAIDVYLEAAPATFGDRASFREFVSCVCLKDHLTRIPEARSGVVSRHARRSGRRRFPAVHARLLAAEHGRHQTSRHRAGGVTPPPALPVPYGENAARHARDGVREAQRSTLIARLRLATFLVAAAVLVWTLSRGVTPLPLVGRIPALRRVRHPCRLARPRGRACGVARHAAARQRPCPGASRARLARHCRTRTLRPAST